MTWWRLVQCFVITGTLTLSVYAHSDVANVTEPTHRRLQSVAVGNVGVCYTPFHNSQYPLFGGSFDSQSLRSAIDDDFRILSNYVTHVRTYYAQHFGIEITPIAAKYGLKLYLGAFLTSENWWNDEANAAANAIKQYPGTVEVILVGNENLQGFYQRSWDILTKINDIKARAGTAAGNVKYGTVQRINEYVNPQFDWDFQQLNNQLDILGVNIYPFFTNSYNTNQPSALLDAQWTQVISKYPRDKIRLTETGYPTSGGSSSQAPNVYPNLEVAISYYQSVVNWTPSGYENKPKFWFQAFDRRPGDPAAGGQDFELSFGYWTTQKLLKRDGFPRPVLTTKPLVSCKSTMQEGVDYSAHDIGNKKAKRAEDCFPICRSFVGCHAFTWTAFNGGTCWLKSSKGTAWKHVGARSGFVCKR